MLHPGLPFAFIRDNLLAALASSHSFTFFVLIMLLGAAFLLATVAAAVHASAPFPYHSQPYARHSRRAAANASSLEVDLGYAIYRGQYNNETRLNEFKGYVCLSNQTSGSGGECWLIRAQHSIRYAQDTTGLLRWQPPRAPVTNRSEVLPALEEGSQCPQSPNSASAYQEADNSESSEDCLFLNVWQGRS